MASSRFMRNSPRTASPTDVSTKGPPNPEDGIALQTETSNSFDVWKEPPLRPPAPSFEDYKGLERAGVLEHMAPLGTMPGQKVRQRVKASEPSRRSVLARQAEASATGSKEPSVAAEVPPRRRSESRKAEERPKKNISYRERDEDHDYNPRATTTKPVVAKSASSRSSVAPTPSSKTAAGQDRLRQVVDSAVERSRELGNELLGLAVRRLFEDSLSNRTLAELLDAVLSQKPTPRQAADFQAYIKIARKQIKAETSNPRRSSAKAICGSSGSASKSPSKSVDRSVPPTMASTIATPTPNKMEASQPPRSSYSSSLPPNGNITNVNGAYEDRSAKRIKRSNSASSTSSLSSLSSIDPAIDLDQGQKSSSPAMPAATRGHASNGKGPVLGKFSARGSQSRRTPAPVVQLANPLHSDDELAAKKRKLHKSFDAVRVRESNVRTMVKYEEAGAALPQLSVDTKPVAGSGSKDDHDDLRSSVSSTHELLVPPPPGAQRPSRGSTPNHHAAGPKREMRKGARIKNSPMKKKSVVAGIAQKGGGRDGAVGYGHAGDNGELDNNDFCTACGGNGEILCCDGCVRAFHFSCLDPPMKPENRPRGEWFCQVCVSRREPQPNRPRGLFAFLMSILDKQYPVAYHLPEDVRHYFEHVLTGEDGEYVDSSLLRAKPRAQPSPDDLLRTHDAKGNVILCYRCGKSAAGGRHIIACDFCPNKVHLDCLDPPLANPPNLTISWRCPAHFDQELLDFVCPNGNRLIKARRPKHPTFIESALRRGVKNNGNIEIINDDSDEADEPGTPGVNYKLQEKSIKLDFIDRVHRARGAAISSTANLKASAPVSTTGVRGTSLTKTLKRKRDADEAMKSLAVEEQDAVVALLDLNPTVSSSDVQAHQSQTKPSPLEVAKDLLTTLLDQATADVMGTTEANVQPSSVDVAHGGAISPEEVKALSLAQEVIRRLEGSDASKKRVLRTIH